METPREVCGSWGYVLIRWINPLVFIPKCAGGRSLSTGVPLRESFTSFMRGWGNTETRFCYIGQAVLETLILPPFLLRARIRAGPTRIHLEGASLSGTLPLTSDFCNQWAALFHHPLLPWCFCLGSRLQWVDDTSETNAKLNTLPFRCRYQYFVPVMEKMTNNVCIHNTYIS